MKLVTLIFGFILALPLFAEGSEESCEAVMEDLPNTTIENVSETTLSSALKSLGLRILPTSPSEDRLSFSQHAQTISRDARAEAEMIKNKIVEILADPHLEIDTDVVLFWAINSAYPELAMTDLPTLVRSFALDDSKFKDSKKFFRPKSGLMRGTNKIFSMVAQHNIEKQGRRDNKLSLSAASLLGINIEIRSKGSQPKYLTGANILALIEQYKLSLIEKEQDFSIIGFAKNSQAINMRGGYQVLSLAYAACLYAQNSSPTLDVDTSLPDYFPILITPNQDSTFNAPYRLEVKPNLIYSSDWLRYTHDLIYALDSNNIAIRKDTPVFVRIPGLMHTPSWHQLDFNAFTRPDYNGYVSPLDFSQILHDLTATHTLKTKVAALLHEPTGLAPVNSSESFLYKSYRAEQLGLHSNKRGYLKELFEPFMMDNIDEQQLSDIVLDALTSHGENAHLRIADLDNYLTQHGDPSDLPTLTLLQKFIAQEIAKRPAGQRFLIRYGWAFYDHATFRDACQWDKVALLPNLDLRNAIFSSSQNPGTLLKTAKHSGAYGFITAPALAAWFQDTRTPIWVGITDANVLTPQQQAQIHNGKAAYLDLDFSNPNLTVDEIENALKEVAETTNGLAFMKDYFKFHTRQNATFFTKKDNVTGKELLSTYHNLRIKEGKIPSDTPELTSFTYIRTQVAGFLNSSDIAQLIYANRLQELFMIYINDPAGLDEIMRTFLPPHSAYQRQPESIAGLIQLARRQVASGVAKNVDDSAPHVLEVVFKRFASQPEILEKTTDRHLTHILLHIIRKDFAANQQLTLQAVTKMMDQLIQHQEYPLKAEQIDRIHRLLAEVFKHLNEMHQFAVPETMIVPPLPSQREPIAFLYNRTAAILSDDVGLGKSYDAIAAYMALRSSGKVSKKMLWVTTKSNLSEFSHNIKTYTGLNSVNIITGGTTDSTDSMLYQAINSPKLFVAINYEMLVNIESHPLYEDLIKQCDVMVVDEGHKIDNSESLRSQATRRIDVPYRWLLSATPYQSDYRRLFTILNWLDPQRFPSQEAFNEEFPKSADGIEALRLAVDPYLLGRRLMEVAVEAKDFSEVPLRVQLAKGKALVPQRQLLPNLTYEPSKAQQQALVEIATNFPAWAKRYNATQSDKERHIDLKNLNPLSQLTWMQTVMTRPLSLGLGGMSESFWQTLDAKVSHLTAQGKKAVFWVDSVEFREALVERYAAQGALSLSESYDNIARFNAGSEHPILVGSLRSGGVGLSIKGADETIMLEWPLGIPYPAIHQALGRTRRIISTLDIDYAKARSDVQNLIPVFTPGFIDGLSDAYARAKRVFSNGTPAEQILARHAENEILFLLFMVGAISEEVMQKSMYAQLFRALNDE